MIQYILVALLFILSCIYIGRIAMRAFLNKGDACGGCAASKLHRGTPTKGRQVSQTTRSS